MRVEVARAVKKFVSGDEKQDEDPCRSLEVAVAVGESFERK